MTQAQTERFGLCDQGEVIYLKIGGTTDTKTPHSLSTLNHVCLWGHFPDQMLTSMDASKNVLNVFAEGVVGPQIPIGVSKAEQVAMQLTQLTFPDWNTQQWLSATIGWEKGEVVPFTEIIQQAT